MDKLSEHAIRMLEIEGKGKNDGYIETRNMGDIARAVYDLILQVQMLKMADRKTEPTRSKMEQVDKDTNVRSKDCETCKHNKLEWFSEVCDGCSKAHSNYEPKNEHSGEVTEMVEPQTEIRKDIPVICAECDHVSIHQKYLFCELSHRTVYNAKPEWCPLPKLFIADDEPKTEPQTERGE